MRENMGLKNTTLLLILALTLCALLLLPMDAFAQENFKGQTERVGNQIIVIPKFLAVVSYVLGAAFAFRAVLALRKFIDNADENPVTRVIGLAFVSAALVFLPYIIVMTATTLNANKSSQNVPETHVRHSDSSFADDGF